jgi:AbrB family looped-hinge helix DNA binding protein
MIAGGYIMLAELRAKSQITIPKELVSKLGINEGDMLEISENNGVIQITPVVVYSKKIIDELRTEINEVKARLENGEQPVFDNIDSLIMELESD